MKRSIVVFGVLVTFLFALSGAYAVENSTWGRIKATFSESPSTVYGDLSSPQPQFLRRSYRVAKVAAEGDRVLYGEKWIGAFGGYLKLGNWFTGINSIYVPRRALRERTLISMSVPVYGDIVAVISEAELGPDGTTFLRPCTVALSYKNADLTGIDEDDLGAWFWHEQTEEWKYIGGKVNKFLKVVTFYVSHFSRYALAPR